MQVAAEPSDDARRLRRAAAVLEGAAAGESDVEGAAVSEIRASSSEWLTGITGAVCWEWHWSGVLGVAAVESTEGRCGGAAGTHERCINLHSPRTSSNGDPQHSWSTTPLS